MGTKLINRCMKHTTDKGHNNKNHNSILAKSQQTKGKMRKKSLILVTHNGKKTILCADKCIHV